MINQPKIIAIIEDFLKDPILRILTIPCRTQLERTAIIDIILKSPEMKSYELRLIDERSITNVSLNKFFVLDIKNSETEKFTETDDQDWK